ncbi:MAG TPA: hypothetical protein VLW52_09340 [Opitutaceae bacterium]|nr:hypothetical protein [Opitutaceae bacterium]
MISSKIKAGLAVAGVIAGAAGLVWQHQTNVRLRDRLADLPALRAENARLRAAKQQAEQRAADLERLRSEPGRLRNAAGMAPERAPGHPAPAARDVGGAPLAAGLVPVDFLGNAGQATPRAAFATQLWAARTGDVALETATLMLEPEDRAKLAALTANLPDEVRARYDPPEKLMALVLADSPHPVGGMQVLGETPQGANDVTLQTEWQHADDTIVHRTDVQMHLTPEGWKMVVPAILVDRAAAFLVRRPAGGGS